jgi:hypothetical protein
MDEIRYQAIKADIQDLISGYISSKVSDDELEGFITLAEADEERVTVEGGMFGEMDYRKEIIRGVRRDLAQYAHLLDELDEEKERRHSRH